MYLYRLEIELRMKTLQVVVTAETDAQAFDYVEELLVRHYIKSPEVVEASIIEKKRAVKGAGYVLDQE